MSKRNYRIAILHESGVDKTLPWLRVGDRVKTKHDRIASGVLCGDRGSVLRIYEEPRWTKSGMNDVRATVKFDEVAKPVEVSVRSLRVLNPVEDIGGLA